MWAMQLKTPCTPLVPVELAEPQPGAGEVRVAIAACGVCRTDLHVVDGDLPHPKLPIIPGHEIVGRIDAVGAKAPPCWSRPKLPVAFPACG
jgi:propanol-preferring alcohol dehydrogenase